MKLKIREVRQSRGWTLAQLAKKANISKPYLWQLENQTKQISLEYALRLSKALHIRLEELSGLQQDVISCKHCKGTGRIVVFILPQKPKMRKS